MKKIIVGLLAVILLATICVTMAEGTREPPWSQDLVYCEDRGLISDAEREQISDQNYWSKIEFLAMTAQGLGIYDGGEKALYQTRDTYYSALQRAGIIQKGEFPPENWAKPVGRYEAAQLCMRAVAHQQGEMVESSVFLEGIGDQLEIPSEYREAVKQTYGLGIMEGRGDENHFEGWSGVTKAEGCVILHRLLAPEARVSPVMPEGFDTLISEFTTSYDAVAQTPVALLEYRENSVYNMMKAGDTLGGFVLNPGQEFSFNRVIGNPGAAQGYKKGIIVSGGKHVPGYGGGVCQLSTTVFNAALRANLPIVERHNHGLRSIYVPAGADSAIYNPSMDLRFSNSYKKPIKFIFDRNEAEMTLTVRIYGSSEIQVPEVNLEIEEREGRYLLTRTADGVTNYTCTSRYRD